MRFLEDLGAALVTASHAASTARAETSPRRPWRRRRRALALGLVALLLSSTAVAERLLTDRGTEATQRLAERPPRGPHPLVEAFGLDPGAARVVLHRPGEPVVAVVSDRQVRCLVVSTGIDQCTPHTEIAAGRGVSFETDCSGDKGRLLYIKGLLPEAARQVRIADARGRHIDAPVTDGVFYISKPTLTSLASQAQWLDETGVPHPIELFPGRHRELCSR